ncbi:hypothetical protein U9M48_014557 [Paspalum notatum var. saurae]|uniref:Uncharacterized protein n=1 Tax=Paspalum notatum var. saurae TaxID=547442 RepID=A0AAQ3T2A5_PASNO
MQDSGRHCSFMQALVVGGVSNIMQSGVSGKVDLVPVYHVILRVLRKSKQMLCNWYRSDAEKEHNMEGIVYGDL